MTGIEFSFENPWLLLIAIPALAVIFFPFLRLPGRRRKTFQKIAPVVIHTIVVTLTVLILSGFVIVKNEDKQSVMVLMDLSDSTADFHEIIYASAEEIIDLTDKKNAVGVLAFADDTLYAVAIGTDKKEIDRITVTADATNIEKALEYAAALMPTDTARRIILLSDGKQTDGSAENKSYDLAKQGIRIDAAYFSAITSEHPETQIGSIDSPKGCYLGDELKFAVELKSNVEDKVMLYLYDNDKQVDSLEVQTENGSTIVELAAISETAGVHSFRIELVTEKDTIEKNNIGYTYVNIAASSSVLIIADATFQAEPLEKILSANCAVTITNALKAPRDMVELCNYDEIILLNVDYDELPGNFDILLEEYVRVYGRGLLTVGGENTYMYGNMKNTAIAEMMPVILELSESESDESIALMLVLDCSGSMVLQQEPTNLSLAKQGAIQCIEAMSENDQVGIISFNRHAYLNAELTQATDENKGALERTVSALTTASGTYYTESLKMAHEQLAKATADVKHVIFLSDGSPKDSGYNDVVAEMYEDGITVSTIGLVDLMSTSVLENMAVIGGGEFYYVGSAYELPDIMLSETERVVISSLIEGEYTPIITEDSALTAEIDKNTIPKLYGYLGTTLKKNAKAYLSTEKGHPIYASWQYGAGTVSSFMSDLSGEWSSEWMKSETGKYLTAQMTETTIDEMHNDSSMSAEITVNGKTAEINVTTLGFSAEHTVTVLLSSANGSETYILTQTEKGVYQGTLTVATAGIYQLLITESDQNQKIIDQLETGFSLSYSSEYDAFTEGGKEALTTICSFSEGMVTNDIRSLASIEMDTIKVFFDPLILFVIISSILMLADIAIRKIRWKDLQNDLLRLKNKMKKS